jgi:hypothetical protein
MRRQKNPPLFLLKPVRRSNNPPSDGVMTQVTIARASIRARTESTLNGARPGYARLIQWSMEISQVRHRLWPFKTPDTDRDEFVWLTASRQTGS